MIYYVLAFLIFLFSLYDISIERNIAKSNVMAGHSVYTAFIAIFIIMGGIRWVTGENIIPGIVTGFDHTPRSGWQALVMKDFTPEAFKKHVEYVIQNTNPNPNIVFIKSWNEWAEGNYIEPDLKYGRAFLDVLRKVIC